jgi:asparagine synthase (glutamine-hydrolysing)
MSVGTVEFLDADIAQISEAEGQAAAWAAAFARFGMDAPSRVRGDFAVAVRDSAGRTLLAVDRFAIRTLCYRFDHGELRVAERADELGDAADTDAQAIYEYLYFHVIPAPRTAFRGVHRLPAGHCALIDAGKLTVKRWWTPVFAQGREQSLAALGAEFRELLRVAVAERSNRGHVGCFLSGGTDSSTVAGMLGLVTHSAPQTFSIGFDAKGYDEMAYARIAAGHFKAAHHEYYVTPQDIAHSIPSIAAVCDQPFGNSSVVPAYYCAKMAKDAGIDTMLAGDGGDELFGGNTRYVRQRILAAYDYIPGVVRKHVLEPILVGRGEGARIPGLAKAKSYVEQARVPMPDRMHGYNLLLRLGIAEVLTPEFLSSVDPELPLRQQRETYAESAGTTLVNRMLAYDWKFTLADNDLPKVNAATMLAGVAASYPMLDDRLVDFSLRLDSSLKVKGVSLRWFFKKALRGFLPAAIIAKRKHGFGLPFGVWMTQDARLQAIAMDSLALLRNQGIVRTDFLDRLTKEFLPQHPGYYGEMVWILMMFAQWGATRPRRASPDQRVAR